MNGEPTDPYPPPPPQTPLPTPRSVSAARRVRLSVPALPAVPALSAVSALSAERPGALPGFCALPAAMHDRAAMPTRVTNANPDPERDGHPHSNRDHAPNADPD